MQTAVHYLPAKFKAAIGNPEIHAVSSFWLLACEKDNKRIDEALFDSRCKRKASSAANAVQGQNRTSTRSGRVLRSTSHEPTPAVAAQSKFSMQALNDLITKEVTAEAQTKGDQSHHMQTNVLKKLSSESLTSSKPLSQYKQVESQELDDLDVPCVEWNESDNEEGHADEMSSRQDEDLARMVALAERNHVSDEKKKTSKTVEPKPTVFKKKESKNADESAHVAVKKCEAKAPQPEPDALPMNPMFALSGIPDAVSGNVVMLFLMDSQSY